ncbi:MAG TPA: response regulator transcription factor, partial [Synergistaceae bacterium]|nr:response regulator transcription factor [Synergistaceae bacterium]
MRVLLADDHTIVREGIRLLLSRNPEITIVAEVADGRSAVEQALALRPDVVVMDIMMPDMDGILATKKIKEKVPHVKIIALSMYADKKFITEMLQAGASGFLLKDC